MEFAYLGAGAVATFVVCAILYYIRKGVRSQAWKDFLGITMAFVVLLLAMVAMIVGEHYGT
jgi:hypothetical protein